jgi:imidazoleglycerol phosphate synthase glutamine amidotransferase subunit HisH
MISIIDYGVGNLGSISNMINYLGGQCKIIKSPSEISNNFIFVNKVKESVNFLIKKIVL